MNIEKTLLINSSHPKVMEVRFFSFETCTVFSTDHVTRFDCKVVLNALYLM